MVGRKNAIQKEHLMIFWLCLAVIAGPAIAALFANNLTYYPDCKTYLGIAHFDFNQSPVRRYRVIIPFAAAALNYISGGLFARLSPSYFDGDFSMSFSFFIINSLLTAWAGQLIYRYCKSFGLDKFSSISGTLVFLTCRYTAATAAYPLVDSLFMVVVAITLLGIKLKHTNLILTAIFLGPFAKESFIFIAPLILFFSHLPKLKLLLFFALSGILVFSFRYGLDALTLKPFTGSIRADLAHLYLLKHNARKLFSFYTLFKIAMNIGLWGLAPLICWVRRPALIKESVYSLDKYLAWFLVSVLFQMLLSGSMERMFYIAMPLFCVIIAFSVAELKSKIQQV